MTVPPLAEAFVRIRPDTSTFGRELSDDVKRSGKNASKAGVSIGQNLGSGMRVGVHKAIPGIAKGLFAGFAALKGIQVFSGFIADAQESARVSRLTEAAIKSTGGAAKVTAGQIGALAEALSNKTGIDDETIQSGQNLLLTFTGIRNEVGKGNDIFNQASTSVLDMAAALNNGQVTTEGVKSSTIQLGKALNDPIKGVTALRKVGVSFTQQQTDQIKKLVESGHTLDAQKIILRELGKEFGGAAAASADPMTKLRTILGNVGEDLGTLVLPLLNRFATFLTGTVIPAVKWAADIIKGGFVDGLTGSDGLAGVLERIGDTAHQFVIGFKALVGAFQEGDVTSDGFIGKMEQLGVALRKAFDFFKAEVLPRLKEFASFLVGTVIPVLGDFAAKMLALVGFFTRHTTLLKFLAAAILLVVVATKLHTLAMAAQAAGGYGALLLKYLNSIKLVQIATKVWTTAQWLLNIAMRASLIGIIITAVTVLVGVIIFAATKTQFFQNVWRVAWGAIKKAFDVTFNWIKKNWPLLLGILTGPIGIAVVLIIRNWDKIKAGAKAMWDAIKSFFQDGARVIVLFFLDAAGTIIDGLVRLFGWIKGIGPKLKEAAANFRTFRDDVNRALGGVKDRKITVTAEMAIAGGGISPRAVATGGAIYGPGTGTSDSIPAMLSAGEHVITAREVKGLGGHDAVRQIRRAAVQKFATGGMVRAEDGSLVPASFYSKPARRPIPAGMVRAEDGSLVPRSFYTSGLSVRPRLAGRDGFDRSIAAFNNRTAALAVKLAAASGFNAGLSGAVNFGRAEAGKPYLWGGVGPSGYDCSGFVSNLVSVAMGLPLHRRLFSTSSMRNYPWRNKFGGAFEVGWFTGNPGHTGATVNGVNMESRGGDGVVVGSRSRGANYTYFNQHARLAAGGPVLPGDPPFDFLDPRGRHYVPGLRALMQSARRFDTGGWLPPKSATVAVNGTNQWEPVGGMSPDALRTALSGLRFEVHGDWAELVDDRNARRRVKGARA